MPMENKVKVNIIYNTGKSAKGPKNIRYEDDRGVVWQSRAYDPSPDVHNIGLNQYSLKNPQKNDSIYVVEPRCVLSSGYEERFLKKYKYIFTWASEAMPKEVKDKVIPLNYASCGGRKIQGTSKQWLPWKDRSNEIVFIANNKRATHPSGIYTLRTELADLLYRSKFKVSWYGQLRLKKPYFKGAIPDKMNVLKKARFTVCTENCYHPQFSANYLTEKLPEAWFAGAVPLYMGCYNIDKFGFPPESYIDLRKFVNKQGNRHKINFNKLSNVIKSYTEDNYNKMTESIKLNAVKPGGLHDIISHERVYKKMIDTFYLEDNKDSK